ncbi:virion structural protein [Cyanophage S-TIM61]|nr:virion structural protein [Cyanophage S-TIM61]
MSEYFSFLQATRPKIGLVDRLNLSEIYPEDQDRALRNLLLPPESLDEIRGLAAEGLGKEDIRLIAGLDQRVIDSLALFEQTDARVTTDVQDQVRSNKDIGENGKSSLLTPTYSDNIIMLHGGIAANAVEYKFKDKEGNLSTATVSTSRESLFNAERDTSGRYTNASYGGTLRVRRRGHYSNLKLAKNLFVSKSGITESPTNVVKVPVYMQTPNTPSPPLQIVNALASKNSPLRVPVKINNTGNFTIFTQNAPSPYYFGYELRRKSDNYKITGETFNDSLEASRNTMTRSINTTGKTGNNSDAYLYIYCSPSIVEELKLEGLGIEEDDNTPDLGLLGFDNLKVFSCQNNRLSTVPTWLKVNHFTLEELDLRGNMFWDQGIIEWFDWQTNPGLYNSYNSSNIPVQTGVQILAYSGFETSGGGAKKTSYDGTLSTATAGSHLLHQTRLNPGNNGSFTGATGLANGIRRFTALRVLRLGSRFKVANPDFSVIFPNLGEVNIATSREGIKNLYGNLPKLNNNLQEFSINYSWQTQVGGSMRDVGDNIQWASGDTAAQKQQFIGQFKVITWDVDHLGYNSNNFAGGICTDDSMVGNVDLGTARVHNTQDTVGGSPLNRYSHVAGSNAATAWEGWLNNAKSINFHQTDVAFNLATGENLVWQKLESLTVSYTRAHGRDKKIRYNPGTANTTTNSSDYVKATELRTISSYNAGWTGRLFSVKDCPKLNYINVGAINWDGYAEGNLPISQGGTGANEPGKYILPLNFLHPTTETVITNFQIYYNRNFEMKFRYNDFDRLTKMTYLQLSSGRWSGRFPRIPGAAQGASESLALRMRAENNRFFDLSALSVKSSKRLQEIYIRYSGTNVGGAIVPDMAPLNINSGSTILRRFYASESLPSKYPSSWAQDTSKANKPVFNALAALNWDGKNTNSEYGNITQEQWVSGSTTFKSRAYKGAPQSAGNILLKTAGVSNLQKYVRVGDLVIIDGSVKGRVGSVFNEDPSYEYIVVVGVNSTGAGVTLNYSSNKSVTFRRQAIECDEFFNGCPNTEYIYMKDCSLGGFIPNFKNTGQGRIRTLDLQSNLLTCYRTGTLQNITGASNAAFTGRAQTRTINLENNPLSRLSIRRIIQDAYDVYEIMGNNRLRRLRIKLKATKPDISAGTYSNWQLNDIFDTFSGGAEDPLKTKLRELNSSKITIDLFDVPIV